MACNAYLADITDPKHRTKRIAFNAGFFYIGFNAGKALSGIIKEELGFMHNFALSMLASVLTGIYSFVFLKDSTRIRQARLQKEARLAGNKEDPQNNVEVEEEEKYTTKEKLRQLFSLKNVKAGVK